LKPFKVIITIEVLYVGTLLLKWHYYGHSINIFELLSLKLLYNFVCNGHITELRESAFHVKFFGVSLMLDLFTLKLW